MSLHSISRRIVHVRVRAGIDCVGRYRDYRRNDPVTAIHTIMYSFDRSRGILSYGATTFKKNSVRRTTEIERVITVRNILTTIRRTKKTGDTWNRRDHVVTAASRHDLCPVTVQFAICLDPTKFLDTDDIEEFIVDHLDDFGRQHPKSNPDVLHSGGTLYPYRDAIRQGERSNGTNATTQSDLTTVAEKNAEAYHREVQREAFIALASIGITITTVVAATISGNYHWATSIVLGIGSFVLTNGVLNKIV